MPTSTFLHLDEEKKSHILSVCYREFAQYNYREASVTRIVHNAGIAKGSIYKYFQDKKELYEYLIEHAIQEKLGYIDRHWVNSANSSVWDDLWAGIEAGARFDFDYPQYARFLDRVLTPANDVFDIDIRTMVQQRSYRYMQQFIQRGVERGEIRTDMDADLICGFVNLILTKASHILAEKSGMSVFEFTARYSEADLDEILNEVRDLFRMIVSGIQQPRASEG